MTVSRAGISLIGVGTAGAACACDLSDAEADANSLAGHSSR